mgnify:CR=1
MGRTSPLPLKYFTPDVLAFTNPQTARYHLIEDERRRPHTVYSLATDRLVDLFALRRRHAWLESVVDAEYGSAAFFPTGDRIAIELRVSTTGLLFRPLIKAF